jgi:hypothetical protein
MGMPDGSNSEQWENEGGNSVSNESGDSDLVK